MARAIDKETMLDLIIKAKRTDPETGSFAEWLAEYLVEHLSTLTPPNEPLTLEQLQEMDGEPIYSGKYKRWFLVTYFAVLNRSQLMDSTGTPFVADDCGPLYLCPPEGEEYT